MEGSVYLTGENLEELHELLKGGFLDDNEDFNRVLESATTAEENVEGKKVYVSEIWGKECVSSRGLKRHETLKHTREVTSKNAEKPKKTVSPTLQISHFEEVVKECAKLCHGDSCLPEDIRNMFDSFEFDRQVAVDLWEILEPVITKFHGDAERFYCSFYGLLQDNILSNKFGGDISLTNILLAEIGNHLLSFFNKSECKLQENPLSTSKVISERDQKNLQYIAGYAVHKLYTKFKFSKNKDTEYCKQCSSILLCCMTDSDSAQTLINSQDRGGLWRVNDNVQNIFIECEKIFRLCNSNFQTVINSAPLVQEMKGSPCVILNFDALCYNIEPKVNKEFSLNLLENMLLLFTKVRVFSFARDVKGRSKTRIKKPKSQLLRKEIKKASSSKN